MTAIRSVTTSSIFFRPSGRIGPTIAAILVGFISWSTPSFGGVQPADPDANASPELPINSHGTPVERALSALRNEQAGAETEITRLLAGLDTTDQILAGLSEFERLPPGLWRPVSTCTTPDYPQATRITAIRLLPRFGSREAATRLLAVLEDELQPLHQPARQALRDLTGLGDGWGNAEWMSWGVESSAWSDRAWTSTILARQVARARAQSDRQRMLGDELVALYRRLHVELEAAGRTTLLAELIRDDRAAVRDLGFELAGRDLSARTQLGPEVASAAAARLTHPDAQTRARAATLVSRLVPPDAMLILTRALQTESSPLAAEPMLLGVARWPNEDAVLASVRWLEREDAPFGAVTTALWAMAQADLLSEPSLRERILRILRERDPVRGGETALKLLVRLGNADDLAKVAGMVASPEDPVRNAAAGALAETRAGSLLLIDAATSDPRLFGHAARAINAHHVSPEGMRQLATLPAIESAARDTALIELGTRIRPEQLAQAVTGAGLPPMLREYILTRRAENGLARTPGVADGLLLLAETRLDLRRPADALTLIRSIDPEVLGETQTRTRTRLSLIATLMTGDIDAADQINGKSSEDWIDAWRRLPETSELRPRLAQEILRRFAQALTAETLAELGQTITETTTLEAPPTPPDNET
jgi:hypothetical protein